MKVRGATTLLLTLIILLLSLTISLTLFRGAFHHVAQLNERIAARSHYWQAEGALECAYAVWQLHGEFGDFSSCRRNVDTVSFSGQGIKTITVVNDSSTIEKSIDMPLPENAASIKTTANLILRQSAVFTPDPAAKADENEWQCTVVLYKHHFEAPNVTTLHPYQMDDTPYPGFPDSRTTQQRCSERYYSAFTDAGHTALDYRLKADLEPFKDVFGIAATDWFTVMSHPDVAHVPAHFDSLLDGTFVYSAASQLPRPVYHPQCATQIAAAIQRGKDIIWIYGGCELDQSGVQTINQAIGTSLGNQGIIIVVQDGLLAIHSDDSLQGLLMQFISPEYQVAEFGGWQQTSIGDVVQTFRDASAWSVDEYPISYFQVGAFFPDGGLVLAGEQTYAIMNSALNGHFNRELVRIPLSRIRAGTWLAGSWHGN